MEDKEIKRNRGSIWLGLFLLLCGTGLVLRQLDTNLPAWLFSWEILLMALGLFIGARHQFKGGAWLVPILIGGVFLMSDIYPDFSIGHLAWPIVIIIIGLWFIVKPRYYHHPRWTDPSTGNQVPDSSQIAGSSQIPGSSDDYLDITAVLGGIKKNILSKDFKGGDLTAFMGGMELNLSQADINGVAVLDVTQVMGGTKLIVPSNWDIKSELVSVLAGIEDKRTIQPGTVQSNKVLILRGTSVLGGIEIRNY